MNRPYSTCYKSVVRAVNDTIKDIQIATGHQLKYWDWENRMDEDKMPRETLFGVNGFSWEENGGLWLIRFGITLSMVDDDNLIGEAEIIDIIHERFGEKQKIKLRDPDNGDETNELVSVAFEVLPMGPTQVRNYRSIGVEVLRTGT